MGFKDLFKKKDKGSVGPVYLYTDDEIKELENLTKKITHVLQQALLIQPKVKLVEPKTLERSEGKAKRVIDNRKL